MNLKNNKITVSHVPCIDCRVGCSLGCGVVQAQRDFETAWQVWYPEIGTLQQVGKAQALAQCLKCQKPGIGEERKAKVAAIACGGEATAVHSYGAWVAEAPTQCCVKGSHRAHAVIGIGMGPWPSPSLGWGGGAGRRHEG